MKNSEMPAMPVSELQASDIDCAVGMPKKYGMPTGLGLTKREHFAGLAMQGLLSNSGGVIQASNMAGFAWCNTDEEGAALMAVSIADALLTELDRSKP